MHMSLGLPDSEALFMAAPGQLRISIGQYSDKGRKEINQDFHGVYIAREPQLSAKGIALALADESAAAMSATLQARPPWRVSCRTITAHPKHGRSRNRRNGY
jgi:hypothetical protein